MRFWGRSSVWIEHNAFYNSLGGGLGVEVGGSNPSVPNCDSDEMVNISNLGNYWL